MLYTVSIVIPGAAPAEELGQLDELILDIVGRRNPLFNGIVVHNEQDGDELGNKRAMTTPL